MLQVTIFNTNNLTFYVIKYFHQIRIILDRSISPKYRTLTGTTAPGQSGSSTAQSAGTEEYTDCISAERQDSPNECPGYNTKQSDGEVPVMLELWGIRTTPLLPSLPGPLGSVVIKPDRVRFMG